MTGFCCDQCSKTFTQKVNLDRHKTTKHSANPSRFQCHQCPTSFSRKDALKRHQRGHATPARVSPSQRTDLPLLANADLSEPYSVSHNASPAHYSTTYRSPGQLPSTSRAVTDQAFTTSRAVHEQRLVASRMASGQPSVSHRVSEPQPSTSRAVTDQAFTTSRAVHEQRLVASRMVSDQPSVSHRASEPQPSTSRDPGTASTSESYQCPDCDYTCQDWCIYVRHRGRCHQFGYGEEDQHIVPALNAGGEADQALQDLYRRHAHEIFIDHYQGVVHADYNFPTENGAITYRDIRNYLEQILRSESNAFKVNMAFGLILRDTISGEYTYFHPMQTDPILDRPVLISNQRDIDTFMEMLKSLNILEHLSKRRPNTRKIFHSVANVMFYVNRTDFVLGAAEDLPDYVKNKKSIITLIRDRNGKDLYEDNKCLFRCLALQLGATQGGLEKKTCALLGQWCSHKNIALQNFKGVQLKDIPQVEDLFHVNINIHQLMDSDTAVSVYLSSFQHPTTLYCNLWGHHLSYIKNFNVFASRFQCHHCDKLFKLTGKAKQHEKTCDQSTKFRYPGGYHRVATSVFEDLESNGIHVPEEDRLYPFFACFDFEAMLVKNMQQKGDATTVLQSHQPISVAVASNVCHPDCEHTVKEPACHLCQSYREPVCFVESDVGSLLDQLFIKTGQIQEAAEMCTRKKLQDAFVRLEQKISVLEAQKALLINSNEEEEEDGNSIHNTSAVEPSEPEELVHAQGTDVPVEEEEEEEEKEEEEEEEEYSDFQMEETVKQLKIFQGLKSRLDEYAAVLPLLGFNNAR